MTSTPFDGFKENILARSANCRGTELERTHEICLALEILREQKQNLFLQKAENERILKGLLRTKNECKTLKSSLNRELFYIKVSIDKQNILSKKKLDEYLMKKKFFEQKFIKIPLVCELEELNLKNNDLLQQYNKLSALIELNKQEYHFMINQLRNNFRKKVCEFSNAVLSLQKFNS